MNRLVVALTLTVAAPARAADISPELRGELRRAQTEMFVGALAESDAATVRDVRQRLNAVIAHARPLAARYPLSWWRTTSLARARALADEFAQVTLDLERQAGGEVEIARGRAIEVLVELAALAGANRGAPRDRLPELRVLTVPMLLALWHSSVMMHSPYGLGFTAAMTAAYGGFEGWRRARLIDARTTAAGAWGPPAVAERIYGEFGRRLKELRPGIHDDLHAGEFITNILAALRADGREVLDVCDVLLARARGGVW